MRKVLISGVILVVIIVLIVAGIALRPVSAPSDALTPSPDSLTPTAAESCGVIDIVGTPMSSQEKAVQDAVANQLNQLKPPIDLALNDTGLNVTPAVSKCIPMGS